MSEAYGRKPSILIPIFGLTIFSFASATAKDIQTLLITRFFGGVFGGAPLSNVGGVLADIWPVTQRGPALLMWGLSVIIGPLIAPIVGGALVISMPTVGWRWTEYVSSLLNLIIMDVIGLRSCEPLGHWYNSCRHSHRQRHMDRRKLSSRASCAQSQPHSSRNQELGDSFQESRNGNITQGSVAQVSYRSV